MNFLTVETAVLLIPKHLNNSYLNDFLITNVKLNIFFKQYEKTAGTICTCYLCFVNATIKIIKKILYFYSY